MTNAQKIANVVILGAGPAGTAAAAQLGMLGVKDVVLVDRHDFPRDKTCGSGISPKGIETLKQLGVWHEIEPHSYKITGIRIVTPGGYESWQSAGDVADAVVCQRRTLDHILLKKAVSRGVEFIPNYDAAEVLMDDGRVCGIKSRDGREIRAKYVVIAGGSHCKVGLPEKRPRRTIHAIMGWWEGVSFRPGHVEMIFDRMIEPYYGWLFPENDTRVNIGITYEDGPNGEKQNARELFQRFLDAHYKERLVGSTQLGAWKGHPVVWSYDIEKLTQPGSIVVGESGLMTHPATAEGIYQGMRSGMMGAEALSDVLSGRMNETRAFANYEKRCKKTFHLSFLGGGVFRRLVRTNALDWMIKAGDTPMMKATTAKLMAAM
jgi:geranylgeranyl reductase family protein